ncbi:unnamed protein product [Cuscuta epithymum]|uniref:AP-3 complex subunit beta C-terminal domain-containing protein n=2 Tax=Cuscuta epithymum TaxID=186058 RepID=A0AAV0EC72_9ASTE|nr:unnamed protein product [Cuscuta epithymum]
MFSQFGATADSLSKASTLAFRIGTDAHLYDDPDDVNIAPLLDSKFDSEKCEALKRLLALIAQGFDVSNFFPQVVKMVASQSLEVKKLAYLYLLHYAEKRPNEALLSINCFQKDLGDPNPLVRAWALRTMAGIRLHMIAPIVLVATRKCARDPSIYVRKCAANALPKLHDLQLEENKSTIEEIVGVLLNDNAPTVVGAAAAAFASVSPNNLFLIGKNFRKLCETLPDVEEWGQIVLIGILLRYAIAFHGLVEESIMMGACSSKDYSSEKEKSSSSFIMRESTDGLGNNVVCESEMTNIVARSYLDGPDKYLSRSSLEKVCSDLDPSCFTSAKDNDDVKILLQCTSPLLWSRNSAVVLAAAGVHWIMAPRGELGRIVKPLLFLLRSSNASRYVVLCNIQVFAKTMPSLFRSHFEDFFISPTDSYQIKFLKLEILSLIATESSTPSIFQEFQDYVRDPDRRFAADSVAAIGLCAQRLPNIANTCVEGLLTLISSEISNLNMEHLEGEELILIQAINSLKTIIKHNPSSHEKVIIHLVRILDSIRVPKARATIIWIFGEYNNIGHIIPMVLSTVLKYLAWCFTSEAPETKLQIINACVKVVLRAKGENMLSFRRILNYILELAKCDLNYDLRDRARFIIKLLPDMDEANCQPGTASPLHLLAERLFVGQTKSAPGEPLSYQFYLPGSLSHMVLHAAPGYEPLPQPQSLIYTDTSGNSSHDTQRDSYEEDDPNSDSESLDDESLSGYSSQDFPTSTSGANPLSDHDENPNPLILLSDLGNDHRNEIGRSRKSADCSNSNEVSELLSNRSLESWLNDNPASVHDSSDISYVRRSFARISMGDIGSRVKPKSYTLLDPANGSGLSVDYMFSTEISSKPQVLVCVELCFKNCSTEPMSNLLLVEEGSNRSTEPTDQTAASSSFDHTKVSFAVPMEVIALLEPGQTSKRTLEVHFHHHLLPLKFTLWCDGKKHTVKLRPDIGYFVRPLPIDTEIFLSKESQLPGMFEYVRRCSFTDHMEELKVVAGPATKDSFVVICEALVLKVLSNTSLFLVSVDMPVGTNLDDVTGLRLRFSGEILSNSFPCLLTITIDEGKCHEPLTASLKVNCEETVFGLNLLNRVVSFLAEPTRC